MIFETRFVLKMNWINVWYHSKYRGKSNFPLILWKKQFPPSFHSLLSFFVIRDSYQTLVLIRIHTRKLTRILHKISMIEHFSLEKDKFVLEAQGREVFFSSFSDQRPHRLIASKERTKKKKRQFDYLHTTKHYLPNQTKPNPKRLLESSRMLSIRVGVHEEKCRILAIFLDTDDLTLTNAPGTSLSLSLLVFR